MNNNQPIDLDYLMKLNPTARIAAYREMTKPQPTAEEVEAQKQRADEIWMQVHLEREAEKQARTLRFIQESAEYRKRHGY